MTAEPLHPAVARILREHGAEDAVALLAERLSGADLTSVLLEVMRRRALATSAHDVLVQYERDRFVQPAAVDPRRVMAIELAALDTVAATFEPVATSPLAPLGTHSVIAGVHQHRVVTTVRGTEVAADPTNSLALEAAVRRRAPLRADPRSATPVRLAAVDRVVRAQRFDGPRSFAHFSLLGLVTAGRDVGNRRFERDALVHHVRTLAAVCRRLGLPDVRVQLSDFSGECGDVLDAATAELGPDELVVARWPGRELGRGYYPSVCWKVGVVHDGEEIEVADGGLVDWSQRLLGNAKERMMISGLGLERLALVAPHA